MPTQTKTTVKTVFITLFLDLIGFSIIFPLFPAIIQYYTAENPNDPMLRGILALVHLMSDLGGSESAALPIVLFGGLLGGIYSLLQFGSAPFWGALSDKIGRKKVLLITVSGLGLSYLLWALSGSFTLLVLARILGGAMSGNTSTATAAIADVTTPETRSKGMAFVGIAFALGFILGPALGGYLALFNPLSHFPSLSTYGINPFSTPATLSFILSLINVLYIIFYFKETLPAKAPTTEKEPRHVLRSLNPFYLFRPLPYPGANLTNLGYFFFLSVFSGMEFTLTFLALERLHYTPAKNATLFVYIGVILTLIQGGVVRRKAHSVGEKKMALMGLGCVLPGLLILGNAFSAVTLYLGLTFLAIGSAMAIPCLTSLVSLYTPREAQGRSIGAFRSLGALSRAIGPFIGSILYWRMGSQAAYMVSAALLLIPLALISRLPHPQEHKTA